MEIDLSKLGVTPGNWSIKWPEEDGAVMNYYKIENEQGKSVATIDCIGANQQDIDLMLASKDTLKSMICFCYRVESGSIRSFNTYSHFVKLIEKAFPGFTWEEIKRLAVKN